MCHGYCPHKYYIAKCIESEGTSAEYRMKCYCDNYIYVVVKRMKQTEIADINWLFHNEMNTKSLIGRLIIAFCLLEIGGNNSGGMCFIVALVSQF